MIVEENLELELEENTGWDPRIHSAKCGSLVRAYIIVCKRFVLVYDTLLGPQSGGWLRDIALKLAKERPLLVVNSHSDWDHCFGNSSFSEPIMGSELCSQRILGEVGTKELALKKAEHPKSYSQVSLVAPSIIFSGEATLNGGDLTIRILPTPGHRPDHLSLFIPQIATLFPGDCVEAPIPLVDEDSDGSAHTISELIASLERMIALKPKWVLANHADPEAGTKRIKDNLAYLYQLQQLAGKTKSLKELRSILPAAPHWKDFYKKAHNAQVAMAWEQR